MEVTQWSNATDDVTYRREGEERQKNRWNSKAVKRECPRNCRVDNYQDKPSEYLASRKRFKKCKYWIPLQKGVRAA